MRLRIRSLAMTMGIILRQSELRGNRLVINEVVPNSAYFTGRSVVQKSLSQKLGIIPDQRNPLRSSEDIYNAVVTHNALDMPADREIEEVVIKDFSNGSLEEAAAAEAK